MSSDELTRTQVKAIRDAHFAGLNYLYRLKRRMIKSGFPPDDPLLQLVSDAYEACWRLNVELNGMAAIGAGRKPRAE